MKAVQFFLLVLLVVSGCKKTQRSNVNVFDTSRYQTIIDSIFQVHPNSIGLMIHLESPQKGVSWSGSVGYSDFENKTPIVSDQPALIASSIKTYISATMLRLQEENFLTIEDDIKQHLSDRTIKLFESDGYDMTAIKIKHLLSHTSGIKDYANDAYLDWIDKNQQHRWTRDEQLELAIEVGDPLGQPEDVFSYADANFLLCTEIMETVTGQDFFTVMRDLLKYEELKLIHTWFPTLEKKNPETKPMVHQYWAEKNWDSYKHDISWDLYGGGGIATTTGELAQFSYNLFNRKIITDKKILDLIFTRIPSKDGQDLQYCLGVNKIDIMGHTGYGHGGFWGTLAVYFPEFDTAVSIYVLDRSEGKARNDVLMALVRQIRKG